MQHFHDSFIFLALSQLIATCLYFLIHHRTRSGLVFIALFVCLASYVAWPYSVFDGNLDSYLYLVSLLTPILLYTIARYLFIDEARMRPVDWGLIAYFICARIFVGGLMIDQSTASSAQFITVYMLPLAILIYFSVMAALYTAQGYRADLLENRRTLRVYFVISTLVFIVPRLVVGLFVYSSMLLEGAEFGPVGFPEWVYAVYIFVLFLGFNLLIFRRHEDLRQLFTETSMAPQAESALEEDTESAAVESSDARLSQRIVALMENRKLYTKQGFAISDLAEELDVYEHKLRRAINNEMKFRNFNQFLNHYRLLDASERLRNSGWPVSRIAYEVGYASLSSFNSVFKNHFGMTPTEYRLADRADEETATPDPAGG